MTLADLIESLDFNRARTLGFLDTLAKLDNVQEILAWRPGVGRAPIAWQMMHLGATDDRHVHVRMKEGGSPMHADYVQRYAGGSTPDDTIPTLDEIRRYLAEQRAELHAHLKTVSDSALDAKPHAQATWTYREWLKILAWHEAHHQGQAHLTLNLFNASK